MATYHEGEIAVQERAGVRSQAARVANGIRDFLVEAAQDFLETQPFVVASVTDDRGQVWAVPVRGPLAAVDGRTVQVPETLSGAVGLVILDFATRRRMRINGIATNGLLQIRECYANCPKYIQRRGGSTVPVASLPTIRERGDTLTAAQVAAIRAADTFFIATRHPAGGADASHRGGNPGFVTVTPEGALVWPDYAGNTMFNTLGNLAQNPESGLLFPDFATGNALLLSGTARIDWAESGERSVTFTVRAVAEAQEAFAPGGNPAVEYSPFNPPVS